MPTTFNTGTAPGKLPLVGHVWPLMRAPIDFIASGSKHGDLVEIWLGPTRAYLVCHPELLRQVLTDDRTFDKGGAFYDNARPIAGNGLGTCPYQDHRRQRRLIQPAFTSARLALYAAVMEREILALTASWEDGQVIDAFPTFYDLAMRISIKTLFAGHAGEIDIADLRASFDIVLHDLVKNMFLPPVLRHLPTPANRRYRRALERLRESVAKIITDYRRNGADHGDLMSILIASPEAGEVTGLSDSEVQDQVMTLLLTSSETVPATLAWALYLLSRHPDVWRRLRDEVDAVVRGEVARWDDLQNLTYTRRVITETLRLYPPAWIFTRMTTKAVELGGTHLPAGATVIFSPLPVHQRDDSFPQPGKFDPERWPANLTNALLREDFATFGSGARKCIGDTYALTELTLTLATIVRHWKFECTAGTDTRPAPLAPVYHPRKLPLRLSPRIARERAHPDMARIARPLS
jgi:pentalenene oxygenase